MTLNTPLNTSEVRPQSRSFWPSVLAVAWLAGFAFCFYQFDLPNSSPKVNRMQIWEQLPTFLANAVDPPQPPLDDLEARQRWKQSGWKNLPQRFGLYGVSLWILLGAWGWGHLALRIFEVRSGLPTLERQFFAMVCGLSVLALMMLACGLIGAMSRTTLAGVVSIGPLIELLCLSTRFVLSSRSVRPVARGTLISRIRSLKPYWPMLAVIPFVMCYIGGAFLPEVDFDVKEYHFGGPKEWFQAGQIAFLPHNVYTSFPFLTEMLTLLGMVLYGDWYWGAVAGKGVLLSFSLLTAVGLFAAGRRWFSPAVGMWAAIIHLSTPWIYRISIIAYAEGGLTCYLFASLFAVLLFLDRSRIEAGENSCEERSPSQPVSAKCWQLALLAGFLAGSGMACKYPGVISVVIPLGAVIVAETVRRAKSWRTAVAFGGVFSLGVLIAMGPWLLKNTYETGNPVYPLLYSVFGGTDWSPELNAKWQHAHRPEHHQLADLGVKFIDVTLKADWLSPLLFGLAPLAFFGPWRRQKVTWLWLYVAYLFGTWWLLTHRIDRFWVPLIPVVSLLGALGATWNPAKWWRVAMGLAATLALAFNFAFMTSILCGYNAYLLDLNAAAEQTARISSPEVVLLNAKLPAGAKVLCVGEAELFDARFPYVYNTVFDQSIFEQWCGDDSWTGPSGERPLKPATEIRKLLHEKGITHVLVNWQEILRYRTTYGYTDFVAPRRFSQLEELQILGNAWESPGNQLLDNADLATQHEIERWGPELIRELDGRKYYKTFEVFEIQGTVLND